MGSMFQTLANAWKIPDLRKKIVFTLFAILIYRLGTAIPTPMIDSVAFAALVERFGQLGQFLDIISGGAFKSVSVLALGISPYINASIIMQLLTFAIPALERLQKEGEEGQKKIQKITRMVTLGLSLVMATSYALLTRGATTPGIPEWLSLVVVILSFAAGAAFIMWLGEQIDVKGVGNGISLIIFIGIASRLPDYARQLFVYFQTLTVTRNVFLALGLVILTLAVFVGIITLVVFIQSAERRIPVQYTKRVVGRKVYGGQSTYLPIKVNQSGVLPVIFAMSLLMVPSTIASFTGSTGKVATWFMNFNSNPLYYVVYSILIVAFTFFYSMISYNPVDIANNLQKNGGYILGIRPGRPTAEFIGKTARRLNWFEAVFLVVLVLMPSFLGAVTGAQGIWFGGTAVLILVGVAMDIVTQLEAQMLMRHYKGFWINKMVRRLVIMGPPGSGKGTWSKILSDRLALPHIASGDLFRQELAKETPLGLQIRSTMEAGQLVQDEVTIGLIEKVIRQGSGSQGFILDGFPRTLVQAEALEAILASQALRLDAVINLAVDESILIERTLARMVCLDCGQPYNALTMRPQDEGICDRCGGRVVRRSDDTEDTLKERFRTYHVATEPLIEFYRDKGLLRVFANTEPPGDTTKAELAGLLGLAADSLC